MTNIVGGTRRRTETHTHVCSCGNVHTTTKQVFDHAAYWVLNVAGRLDRDGGYFYAKDCFTLEEAQAHRQLLYCAEGRRCK